MNFVADESCAMPVIRALREAGHDVVAIAEVARGASDDQVLEHATEGKCVLTRRLKPPRILKAGLDASDNIYVTTEGERRIFFLTSPLIGSVTDLRPRKPTHN